MRKFVSTIDRLQQVNHRAVNHDRVEETLSERSCEYWLYNGSVIPNVKRAPENLWNHGR